MSEPADQPPTITEPRSHQGTEGDDGIAAPLPHDLPLPTRIGRYAIRKLLGKGGFGTVYLAHDEELNRLVAIKVPRPERFACDADIELFLNEARAAAGLKHLGIVTVHDVGRLPDGVCYLVMEYVHGLPLAHVLKTERLSFHRIAEMMLDLAEAVHFAHKHGFVHRDIKPSNILLDPEGRPHIVDFGLAIHERDQLLLAGEVSGTPSYMAPEQVRGESHRLDGRTDVWSIGVLLYEMLTRRKPFFGVKKDIFEEILNREPRPLRGHDDSIPRELERICLKCLAKRMGERYATAADLAEDLRHWLAEEKEVPGSDRVQLPFGNAQGTGLSETSEITARVVPKGLRCFDAQDAGFFLPLLPGARDRDGLPESIAFWRRHLEESEADKTFGIGLIYGPSGCGKTSLVRAGLLPRLSARVQVVYLEASAIDTEARLLNGIRKQAPNLSKGLGLAQALAVLRESDVLPRSKKLVLILDQFEQWLHAQHNTPNPELALALRQCDGRRVQAVLMVRDDFWMAITQFMRELDVPLREGANSASVDLFSPRHARKVLAEFGRAFDCLPEDLEELTPEHEEFLNSAVEELAQDGKLMPVRLSLFCEMVKNRSWTTDTLRQVGGTKGLGVTFLEETFSASTAPPEHRRHQQAARAVLKTLLPDAGTNIKGSMRSYPELLAASGYGRRPSDFDALLHILDKELRLVTPTESEAAAAGAERYFQLTHDYLVPTLREWLTRTQKGSWRGRAQLALEERTAQWSRSRDSRFLPSLPEFLTIALAVPRSWRKPEGQALLRAAARHHALVWMSVVGLGMLIFVVAQQKLSALQQQARLRRTEALVDMTLRAPPDMVPHDIAALRPMRDLAVPILRAHFQDQAIGSRQRLHAALALAVFGEVQEEFLLASVESAPASEGGNLIGALRLLGAPVLPRLWERFQGEKDPDLRARWAATLLQLGDARGAMDMLAFKENPIQRTTFVRVLETWRGDLAGLAEMLSKSTDAAFRSGLCAALGLIEPDVVDGGTLMDLQEVFHILYREAPDAATHSAAGWALQRWNGTPPLAASHPPPPGRQWFTNRSGMTMILIPPGTYIRGISGRKDSAPHEVTIARPFCLCDREVWMGLYEQFIREADPAERPAEWKPERSAAPTDQHPAHMVAWEDAVLFCNWLSRKEERRPCYQRVTRMEKEKEIVSWQCDFDADGYRLPTEAEWEYACRAGTRTLWSFGNDKQWSQTYAIFDSSGPMPVAGRLPNDWGLFDMHGNGREWCWDPYSKEYPKEPEVDPIGPAAGIDRVQRGGGWFDHPRDGYCGFRNVSRPSTRDRLLGFRVACTMVRPQAAKSD